MTHCWCGAPLTGDRCSASLDHDPSKTEMVREVTTLYVSGPMSGHPDLNFSAFHEAASALRDKGFVVMNPAEIGLGGEDGGYADLLKKDIYLLLECDGVAVLEGWWKSRGAQCETFIAGILEMPVRPVEDWLRR